MTFEEEINSAVEPNKGFDAEINSAVDSFTSEINTAIGDFKPNYSTPVTELPEDSQNYISNLDKESRHNAVGMFGDDTIRDWENKGGIDLFEVGRFMNASDALPFVGGLEQAYDAYSIYDISKKVERKERLTEQEDEELIQYLRDTSEQNVRGYTFGGKVFKALADVPAFMVEFLAAGASFGAASAPIAARIAGKKVLGKVATAKLSAYAMKNIAKNAARSTAGKVALHVAGTAAVAARYTPKYQERRLNDFMAVTNKGEMIFNQSQESPAKAALMTAGYTTIDFATEALGGFVGNKVLKTPLTAAINKAPEAVKIALMKAYNIVKPNEAVSKTFSHLGYHGIMRELEEDAVQNVLYGVMGLAAEDNYTYKDFVNTIFPDVEDALVTASVVAITGGAKKSVEIGTNILRERGHSREDAQKSMDNLSATEQEAFVQENLELPKSDYVEVSGEKIQSDEKPMINDTESSFNHAYRLLIDDIDAIKELQKGERLDPINDPYLLTTLHTRVVGTSNEMLQRNTYRLDKDGNYEITGKSLKTILDDHDNVIMDIEPNRSKRRNDLEEYLIARRVLEDMAPNKDVEVSDEQMQEALNTMAYIDSKYKDKSQWFEYTADEYYSFNNRILHLLVDSGNMSQEKYDEITNNNKHRVSFRRELEDTHQEEYTRFKNITESKMKIFKLKGSDKKIKNVFESTIRDVLFINSVSSKNRINSAIAKLEKISPDLVQEYTNKEVLDSIDIKKVTADLAKQNKVKKLKEEQVKANKKNIDIAKSNKKAKNTLLRSFEMSNAAKSKIEKVREDVNVLDKHINALEENNKKHKEELKELNESLKTNESAKKLHETGGIVKGHMPNNTVVFYENGLPRAIKVSKPIYRALESMSPIQFNFLDKVFSVPASLLRAGATITPDFFIRNTLKDQTTAMIQTQNPSAPIDTALAMANMLGSKDLYNKFRAAGGATNLYMSLGDDNMKRIYDDMLHSSDSKLEKIFNAAVHPIRTLEDASGFFENATRVGVFKRSKQRGKSDLEAMYDALEGTLNFGRGGKATKVANRYVPFLNAGVQGIDKMVRTFKSHPVETTALALATITVPDLMLTAYHLQSDDSEDYLELPRWQKDMFYMVKAGDDWLASPKPFTLGYAFGSVPSRFLEYAYTNDKNAFKSMIAGLFGSISPVNDVSGAIPQAIKVPMEIVTNHSFFFDRSFYPDYLDKKRPADRYNQNTSEVAKMLGEKFNISPALVEASVRDSIGGSAKYVIKAGDFLMDEYRKASGEEVNEKISNLSTGAFTGGFIKRDPSGSNSNSVRRFWDRWKEVAQTHASYRSRKGKEKREFKEENADDLVTYNKMKKYKKQISLLNKQIRQINNNKSISGDEKEKRVSVLNKKMTKIARTIVKEVD